jgi:putative endonuclease
MQQRWWVYILRCAYGTHYTGITTDLGRRIRQHTEGKGARYTRGRGPFELVHSEQCAGRAAALRREADIKKMPLAKKLALANVRTSRA